jgi:hypothetical protein
MFIVNEAAADAVRHAHDEGGELSAIAELRRHFPGITDNANARRCLRSILTWIPTSDKGDRSTAQPRTSQ